MHFHKWENLGELYILDAFQFSGGLDFTGYRVRVCSKCKRYQYKDFGWKDCEISGHGKENRAYFLCEGGFRRNKGLSGKISPTFNGLISNEKARSRE